MRPVAEAEADERREAEQGLEGQRSREQLRLPVLGLEQGQRRAEPSAACPEAGEQQPERDRRRQGLRGSRDPPARPRSRGEQEGRDQPPAIPAQVSARPTGESPSAGATVNARVVAAVTKKPASR